MDHDRKVIADGLGEDVRMVNKARPCPCPDLCDFRCNRCVACGRKGGLGMETVKMIFLRDASAGGMPIARGEIGHCQWAMLAEMSPPRMF